MFSYSHEGWLIENNATTAKKKKNLSYKIVFWVTIRNDPLIHIIILAGAADCLRIGN